MIDADFYDDKQTELANALTRLDSLNKQSGYFFRWCIRERLHTAMRPQLIPSNCKTSDNNPWSDYTAYALPLQKWGVTGHWVSFHTLGTTGQVGMANDVKHRLLCHYMLTAIPDAGISEARELLGDTWLFYAKKPTQNIAFEIASSPSKVARRGEKYTRPDFHASAD